MVLGAPGAGKSTFLRKMGLEALKGKQGRFNYGLIPVFVELKRFTEREIEIQQYLTNEFTTCGFPQPKETVNQLLEQGKLLILLDGLDEIPTRNLNPAIDKIQDFVDKYKENRFVASSRTAAYHSSFRRFTDVTIANFDKAQIEQFIQNWFQSEEDKRANTATKCWQALNQAENQGARELAQTPLLLTFLCLVYHQSQNVPNKRSSLYGKALRILLEEWGAEKRVERDPIYQQLSIELEEVLLGKIAFAGFEQDKLFFQKQEIVQQIKSFLTSNLNAPQHLDGEKVLQAIELQQGILVERAADIFSFSHLTFQEYLVAQHLVDNNKIPELVSNYATNIRWQEVFLLVAELMRGGADDLLWLMEQQARQYLTTPVGQKYLVPLLDWSEKMTAGSKSKLTSGKKRAIANAYVIAYAYANAYAIANAYANVLANAYANAYAITNVIANAYANAYAITNAIANAYAIAYANANANALEKFIDVARELDKLEIYNRVNYNVLIARLEVLKARIPDDQQPRKVQRKFSQKIIQTWLEAFQLSLELVTIPQAELEEIDQQYFYVHWLLVKCKEAAMFVSPQTWQQLEEKMLTADEHR